MLADCNCDRIENTVVDTVHRRASYGVLQHRNQEAAATREDFHKGSINVFILVFKAE